MATSYLPFYRRRFVTNWSLQARFALVLAVFGAFFAFALGFLAVRAYANLLDSETDATWRVVAVVGWGFGLTVAATIFGLVVSNRWAGPLFRLERYLREMAQGALPTIQPPRKSDELHGLFATFRAANEALRKRHEDDLATLEAVLARLEQPDDSAHQGAVVDLRNLTAQRRAWLTPPAATEPAGMPPPPEETNAAGPAEPPTA